MLREGFDVEIKGGRHLGSPRVIKNDVFKALRGCCKRWFLWGEGAAWESWPSFYLGFLFGLCRLGSCHSITLGCLIDESE